MSPARLEPEYFERLYAEDPDPWGFATSGYERDKYVRTLDALPPGRAGRALEVGCSIGVFTRMLALRCDDLLAVDCSARAVASARERLRGVAGVRVERRTLPEDTPAGPFDLVVCAEVLYYWSRPVLEDALGRLTGALAPGGSLLAVHWRPRTRTYPLQGDEVHDLLAARLEGYAHAIAERTDRYRLDRFDAPGREEGR